MAAGCRSAKIHVFPHKDVAAADEDSGRTRFGVPGRKLLITDGVFSMDGDIGPLPGPGGSRRKARRHHDGGRRAFLRRAGPQRARHHRPFRPARPRAHPGGHALESHRRAGRIRLRQPRPDRVPLPPRAPVPVFDFAPAGGGGRLPGGLRRARTGAGAHRTAVGQHALFQGGPERRRDSIRGSARRPSRR